MKERLVKRLGFADDKIAAIVVSNPYLAYVIIKESDGNYYLYACQIEGETFKICLKCGTYDEMFSCADMLCYEYTKKTFCYYVK